MSCAGGAGWLGKAFSVVGRGISSLFDGAVDKSFGMQDPFETQQEREQKAYNKLLFDSK